MNPKFTLSLTAGICFSVLASGAPASKDPVLPAKKENGRPATRLRSGYSSRNNHAVRIYPDILKKTMHVVAKENDGKKIDFFVFDLQGVLMVHFKMGEGDHEKINGLKRGKYIYHVFCGDEETAAGKLDIR